MRPYRRWSVEEKRSAVSRMKVETHGTVAAELGIAKRALYLWRDQLRLLDGKAKRELSRDRALELENQRLKQVLGTKALEVDFFEPRFRG